MSTPLRIPISRQAERLSNGRTLNRLRVCHITPALFGDGGVFGGAERYSFELARHMALSTPTVLVSFGRQARRFTTPEGLRVVVLERPWYVRGQRFNPIHLGLIQAVAEADVLHCHQTHTFASEIAALLARAAGRRVFASDLGGGGWCLSAYTNTRGWFHGHLHISAYSRAIAGHEGLNGSDVIYGGVDTALFSPDPTVRREPLVVFVGRLMPHKGVNDLIEALPEGMVLELIGRPYSESYLAKLRELAVGKQVIFRTDCGDAELVQAYRRAMCVVLPSVYRDCYGNETHVPELLGQTPLEAMSCGTPAIVTRVASLPEVVKDGETGFVIAPNDPDALRVQLEWIRDHPEKALEMGRAGRRRVENLFTWNQVVARCLMPYGISQTGGKYV